MGVKISELNEALSVQNSDVLPIVQNGETKKITKENLFSDTKTTTDNLQSQINDIKQTNITITSDYTIDSNSCFKSQNFVNIGINIYNSSGTYSTYSWVQLARLPEGSRPSGERYISGFGCASGWGTPTAVPIMIDANGYIKVYLQTSNLKRIIANGIITL